ncbi:hypothetical protein ACQW08_04790 [Gluconobacter japonicus]|uniref:hypothetical protein n=1 Tax=Gluconobacter japonicus TaxID=376620 RepID=UPI003D26FD64
MGSGGSTGCGVYTATTGGTSGTTTPSWSSTGTVADGTVTWTYSTTCQNVVGTGLEITTDSNSRFNTGIGSSDVTYDNAAIDLSKATNNPSVASGAMLRLPTDGIIDWSANATAAGKNKHIMFYDAEAGFLYQANGSVLMSIHDDGSVTFPGSLSVYGTNGSSSYTLGKGADGSLRAWSYSQANGLVYSVGGLSGLSVHDDGTVIVPGALQVSGSITSGSLALKGTVQLQSLPKATILGIDTAKEGMKLYDSDDHVEVTYRCPSGSSCAWFPAQYGTALSN